MRTLSNAVAQDRIHHAYLFVGSRGTGKTSMAKILAACLNCVQGPTLQPCGRCESCTAIAGAASLDVIEMDAASQNSVDDIRDLRDRVAYAPVAGRHKVYILDEAHMLSTQAWNAFLKTLEEPPPHTIFVLATTEAQKVLPTVVDRCQRFDFRRPSVAEIVQVLRRVVAAEDIRAPEEALGLIARAAAGSFRDALGTLEQLATYSGGAADPVSLPDVLAVLGVADAQLLFAALDAVGAQDAAAALRVAADMADSGRDAAGFLSDLEAHARELMVVGVVGEVPEALRLTPERDERLAAQAGRVRGLDVVRLLDLLAAAMEAVKAGADARTQLELALIKAAAPEVDPSTRALLARMERLEGAPHATGRPDVPASAEGTRDVTPCASVRASGESTPAPAQAPAGGAVAATRAGEPSPALAAVPDPPGEGPPDLEAVRVLWPAVVDGVRAESPMLAAALAEGRPAELVEGRLTVAFSSEQTFIKRKAEGEAERALARESLRALTGHGIALSFEIRDDPGPPPTGDGAPAGAPLADEELIARFVEEFGAEELPSGDDEETH